MGLSQALATSLSGLTATQTGLSLVAGNVANAQTPGYVRKTATLIANTSGSAASSVQVAAINRVLDQFVQSQLRTESAGAAYADLRANMYDQLQGLYGTPGSTSTLESAFNNFTNSLQALTTSPDDRSTQAAVVSAAQQLAQQLNSLSEGIQSLRSEAELGLSGDVTQANGALQEIAQINQQLAASSLPDSTTAALEDQRDRDIDQLSKLMDIRVLPGSNNQVSITTTSGVQLVSGGQASTLSFDPQGTMSALAQWNADPTQRGVGTITLTTPSGSSSDLVASNAIRSGEIAGYLEMRDQTLVQAQDQLDQFAAAISSALSGQPTAGTAVTAGAQNGFAVDIGSLSTGDSVSVNYTDTASGQRHQLTVSGLDFSGGITSVVSQINTALAGTGMTASNPSGTTLQILDDGAANTVDVNSLTAIAMTTSLTGNVALPLFVDEGNSPYTGATTAGVPQSLGFAGRIAVNQGLVDDPTLLVNYQAGTGAADPTRPNFIYDEMVNASLQYSPSAGIGTAASPFTGTASTYLSQIVGLQAGAASNAANLKQGQDVVLSSLQQRFNETSGVNIDQEMADLLNLQNSYAANARVMTTVNAMLTALMQIGA
jgi:flagellar hook-associated protein 1 FlgK